MFKITILIVIIIIINESCISTIYVCCTILKTEHAMEEVFDDNTTGFTDNGGHLENVVLLHMATLMMNQNMSSPNLLLAKHARGAQNKASSTTIGTKLGEHTIVFPQNYTHWCWTFDICCFQSNNNLATMDETNDDSLKKCVKAKQTPKLPSWNHTAGWFQDFSCEEKKQKVDGLRK